MPRARRSLALALLLCAACGGAGAPERGTDARPATAPADLPPEPSDGCRPGDAAPVRIRRETVEVDGGPRAYVLDVPGGATDRPRPLVVAFHGFQGRPGRLRWLSGLGRRAPRRGMIAVFPEGREGVELLGRTGRGWDVRPDDRRDLAFVTALLDRLERERCVDRRRVFATGMSNGGFLANLLGCVLAERVAAVAPVVGAMPLAGCRPARPVPVLLFYGTADRVVPPDLVRSARDWWLRADGCDDGAEGAGCRTWTGCAAEVVACERPHGHRWPRDATERMLAFFARQARP